MWDGKKTYDGNGGSISIPCSSPEPPATNHHWIQGKPRPSQEKGFELIDERCKFCGEERTEHVRSFDDSDWVSLGEEEPRSLGTKSTIFSGRGHD